MHRAHALSAHSTRSKTGQKRRTKRLSKFERLPFELRLMIYEELDFEGTLCSRGLCFHDREKCEGPFQYFLRDGRWFLVAPRIRKLHTYVNSTGIEWNHCHGPNCIAPWGDCAPLRLVNKRLHNELTSYAFRKQTVVFTRLAHRSHLSSLTFALLTSIDLDATEDSNMSGRHKWHTFREPSEKPWRPNWSGKWRGGSNWQSRCAIGELADDMRFLGRHCPALRKLCMGVEPNQLAKGRQRTVDALVLALRELVRSAKRLVYIKIRDGHSFYDCHNCSETYDLILRPKRMPWYEREDALAEEMQRVLTQWRLSGRRFLYRRRYRAFLHEGFLTGPTGMVWFSDEDESKFAVSLRAIQPEPAPPRANPTMQHLQPTHAAPQDTGRHNLPREDPALGSRARSSTPL